MSELATSHQLVWYAVLIIVTMAMLDWLESRRSRIARARRQRCEQLDTRATIHLPEQTSARHQRRTAAKRRTA